MRHLLLSLPLYLTSFLVQSQTGAAIITELKSINQSVTSKSCGTDSAAAISNRAMNVFLADKTGYLSASSDLSFYTNYVTFNSAEGKFTVNHNFQKGTTGNDAPAKKLLSIGFDMTLSNNYAKSFLDKRFENEIGVTVNYKWLGKVKTRFTDCSQNNVTQKQEMDALRAVMLAQLQIEILNKEADFKLAQMAIDSTADAAKKIVQEKFYEDLKSAYEEKFATIQASLLTQTGNFKLISTSWTSISAYIPLLFPKYAVAPSLVTPFSDKHPYPLSIQLGHTRMWESAKMGRLFFTLNGMLLLNNSKLSYGLNKLNFSEYKSLGGTDMLHATDPGNNKLYIGQYQSFITPSLTARMVYFSSGSHVGISFLAEKSFSDYNLLNFKAGIPIVLIN
ncbi:MAG: hypothetical protein ABIR15_06300, partial [Chitinophagaceae bacterium]